MEAASFSIASPWNHGVISRTEAQKRLFASDYKDSDGAVLDGVFLVRRKPQSGVSAASIQGALPFSLYLSCLFLRSFILVGHFHCAF